MKLLLQNYLKEKEPLAIALSGGTDSSALILFCRCNQIKYAGFTVVGPHITDYEIKRVMELRKDLALDHFFFYYDYRHYSQVYYNSKQRCFYCKASLFAGPVDFFSHTHTLADGTNSSDIHSYRPGIKANMAQGIISPFADLGMDKKEVISLALELGLKQSLIDSRSCILARFSYGVFLDYNLVKKVRKVEDYLLEKGLKGFRLRVLTCERFLMQVSSHQKFFFEQLMPGFDELMQSLELEPYTVRFLPFAQITGYYD